MPSFDSPSSIDYVLMVGINDDKCRVCTTLNLTAKVCFHFKKLMEMIHCNI